MQLPVWITPEEFKKLIKSTKRLDHKIKLTIGKPERVGMSAIALQIGKSFNKEEK